MLKSGIKKGSELKSSELKSSESPRIVFHVDMDSFFASCELLKNPALKGKPVIVGADPQKGRGRGVVSTCSYEARRYGVHSAMPISKAWNLCPHGVYLLPDFDLYEEMSHTVMEILKVYAAKFEGVGIDEAYLEPKECDTFVQAKRLAADIQKTVRKKTKLGCSIGIGPNKLIAKIASDYKKPSGITMVTPETVEDFMSALGVEKIPGVGAKTLAILYGIGIITCAELSSAPAEELEEHFGSRGEYLRNAAMGVNDEDLVEYWTRKSISGERTFKEDVTAGRELFAMLDKVCMSVYQTSMLEKVSFRTVTVKLRSEDFMTFTKSLTVDEGMLSESEFMSLSKRLCQELILARNIRRFRLIGVRVSGLSRGFSQMRIVDYD